MMHMRIYDEDVQKGITSKKKILLLVFFVSNESKSNFKSFGRVNLILMF